MSLKAVNKERGEMQIMASSPADKLLQRLKDALGLPIRFIFDHDTVEALGLTSLRAERIQASLRYCRGRVLDVGCGEGNRLVRQHGAGVGVDIYSWPSVDVLCDTRYLPFPDETFDTADFVASLNHIPAREDVLRETHRVLRAGGEAGCHDDQSRSRMGAS